MISPRARRGRSSLTQVMTSPGLSEGLGMAEKAPWAGEGLRVGLGRGFAEGEAAGEGGGEGTWGVTAQAYPRTPRLTHRVMPFDNQ